MKNTIDVSGSVKMKVSSLEVFAEQEVLLFPLMYSSLFYFAPHEKGKNKYPGKILILIVSELKRLKKKSVVKSGLNYAGARLKSPRGKKRQSRRSSTLVQRVGKRSRETLVSIPIILFKYNI